MTPTNDNGPVNGSTRSFAFDPNSSLTFAEQQEKARRIQSQRDNEARSQQLKQEHIWRETKARQQTADQNASRGSSGAIRGGQQRRGGWRKIGDDGRDASSGGVSLGAAMRGSVQGETLGQAMSGQQSKARSHGRTNPSESPSTVRRLVLSERNRSDQDSAFRIQQYKSQSTEPSSISKAERAPKRKAMPSFLNSSAPIAAVSESTNASDWSASENETLPVSYGTAADIRNPAIRDAPEPYYPEFVDARDAQGSSQDENPPLRYQSRKGPDMMRFRPRGERPEAPSGEIEETLQQPSEIFAESNHNESPPPPLDKASGGTEYRSLSLQDEAPTISHSSEKVQQQSAESVLSEPDFILASNLGSFGYYEDLETTEEPQPHQQKSPLDIQEPPETAQTHSERSQASTKNPQPACPAPTQNPVKATSAAWNDSEFIGFGLESDSIDEPEQPLTTTASVGTVQPSLQYTQQSLTPQARESIGSGYRTLPFDPNEYQEENSPPEVDNSANW